ncbi:serine protease inhibitor 27A [Rhagoletis pomonella]|uniref:serine protease inhibitor 27A n=1 Tax=Rhagoletis pomonella TaxID=28610 RepID=UPI0017810E6C|nr:serine protease inhibitor 27A [Rhagoletis pomonella]
MQSKRYTFPYKSNAVVAIFYVSLFTGLVCILADDLPANLVSWHMLDTTNILQNATRNIVVSPKIIKTLLDIPSPIDLRFADGKGMPGQGLIFTKFKSTLKRPQHFELFYNAKIHEVGLNDKNEVLKAINDWGSRSTNNSFPKLFESMPDEISKLRVLILNIIHFNETLQVNFKYSVNDAFYVTPNNTIKVPSVETTDYFDYHDSQALDAKVLRLPYSNNISMYMLLPHTKQGVNELLNNLGYEQLKRVQWMMEEARVNVLLPKFKCHFETDLRNHIQNRSIHYEFKLRDLERAFGILPTDVNMFQITTINFDGSGRTTINSTARQAKFEKFHVDRPFVVYIEEANSGDIIYLGKILNPVE